MGQKFSRKFRWGKRGANLQKEKRNRSNYKRLRFYFRDSYSYLHIKSIDY